MPMKLPLTVACWDYDRTRALIDGRVGIEGCDATFFPLPVEETFFRALRHAEFDIAELSLSSYLMLTDRGSSPYVAVPAFVSRAFRHSAIYVRTDRGIKAPTDLVGRLVGVPEYQVTAAVWVRGLLEDEYGVTPADLRWRTGGVEQPGRHEKVDLTLPDGVEAAPIAPGETLSQMLADGRLDAIVAPRALSCYVERRAHVGRLFPDFRGVERAYFSKTGIFPIMHVVGIRRSLVEQHPWLASSVYKAFVDAKRHARPELAEVAALKISLPWLTAEFEETVALMGEDYWSYGVDGNKPTLEAILRYHHKQGLSSRQLAIAELFVPATLEQVRV
jgi:4,5-dihydroxyphthalate decarboxylase